MAFKQKVNAEYLISKTRSGDSVRGVGGGVCITSLVFLSFGLRETKTKMEISIFLVMLCFLYFYSFLLPVWTTVIKDLLNCIGEGAGNSLIKTVQALSFCHVILGRKSS